MVASVLVSCLVESDWAKVMQLSPMMKMMNVSKYRLAVMSVQKSETCTLSLIIFLRQFRYL